MSLLVDTCIWSLSLRRRNGDLSRKELAAVNELRAAIEKGDARILGIVRQELLSGIKSQQQFQTLKETLSAFPDVDVESADYVEAARLANVCRSKGVAAHVVDMLLCAIAERHGWEIFTSDPDFERYSKLIGVRLHDYKA